MTEARMKESVALAPGTFCWVELGTTDGEGAKRFYSQLFGWESTDSPVGPNMVYTMLKQDGKDVGGLYQLPPEMKDQGVPPHWLSYVSVTSADEASSQSKQLGGKLMKEPFDVMDAGRMAVIQDPTGAVFAVWQPIKHAGAGIYNVPNSFCWNELGTTDPGRATEFYSKLFGWTANKQQFGEMEYTIFQNQGRGAGGAYKLTPEMGSVPPHWLVYFAVEDCDKTVEKATSLGATTLAPPVEAPGVGRFSVLRDPQGAVFAVIKLTTPAQ